MKKISDYILSHTIQSTELERLYINIVESFDIIINESEGLFDTCEELADYLLSIFTKGISYGKFTMNGPEVFSYQNTITKSDFKKLFCNKLRCDFYISRKYHAIHAVTHSGDNVEINKPDVIGIFLPTEEISLYELKGAIIHELLHFYGAQMMYERKPKPNSKPKQKPNYFDTTRFKSFYLRYNDVDEALLGDIMYELQKNELNSFSGMLKPQIDKFQEEDPNKCFKKLQDNSVF